MKYFVLTLLVVALALTPASAAAQHAVGLSWAAGTSGGAPANFNVYRANATGGCATVTAATCTKLGSVAVPTTTYSDTTVAGGQTYFYVVTAQNATGESGPSNEVSAVIPPDAPTAPTGLTVTSVK